MSINRLHGCQVRAARAILNWSIERLAQSSGISESSVRRIEAEFHVPETVSLDLLERMREFLVGRGFRFIWDEDGNPGLYCRRQERRRRNSS